MASSPHSSAPAQSEGRYRVLLDLGRALAEEQTPRAIHETLHREALRILPADGFYIFLWDRETDEARIVFWADGKVERHEGGTFRGSRSDVIRLGRGVLVRDELSRRSLLTLGGEDAPTTRSAIAVPLRTASGIVGAVSIQSYRPHAFDEADLELLQGIADVASIALRHAHQVEELDRRRREAEEVLALARKLSASLDEGEVLDRMAEAARDLLEADDARVWLLEDEGLRLVADREDGPSVAPAEGGTIPLGGRLAEHLLRTREAVILENASESELLPGPVARSLGVTGFMAVPLVAADRAIGALSVGRRSRAPFGPDGARLLHRLAGHAALALENARLHARLHALSLTDPLTGLPNRRHLELHLAQEFAAARRGRPLSVVLFDLDDFKQYNDVLGHLAGDEALRAVAGILTAETRAMNLAARYGGDEFVVVLSDTDGEGARRHAARVARRLARHPVSGPFSLDISWGIAEFAPGLVTPEALIDEADRALYRNKTTRPPAPSTAGP